MTSQDSESKQRRKRRPKPGNLKQLKSVLWSSIDSLESQLQAITSADEIDTAELCKVCHAISQASGTYVKALEAGELEARVQALEQALGA